jgi:hypothetical protein
MTQLELEALDWIAEPDTRLIDLFLSGAIGVNDRQKGLYPLHVAVLKRSYRLVDLLLANGADPTARTRHGRDAYTLAVQLSFSLLPQVDFAVAESVAEEAKRICDRIEQAMRSRH